MTTKRIAFFPGTFDPITFGHLDIIQNMMPLYDQLIIGIAEHNRTKHAPFFSFEERAQLIRDCLKTAPLPDIVPFTGLTIDAAKAHHAQVILRGVRNTTDFAYETLLANTNRDMAPDLTTLFILPHPQFAHISSTLVREIASLGGPLEKLVPEPVIALFQSKGSSRL